VANRINKIIIFDVYIDNMLKFVQMNYREKNARERLHSSAPLVLNSASLDERLILKRTMVFFIELCIVILLKFRLLHTNFTYTLGDHLHIQPA